MITNMFTPQSVLVLVMLAVFLHSSNVIKSQPHNALAFDGVDDYVNTPFASGLIAGLTTFSVTCWVYPTNAAPSYPNFDGFLGFRNESNADFYILQLTANSVEARFRNSAGTPFTITQPGLVLNTWQHYAMTYNGTTLRLYRNGVEQANIPASGTITASGNDFFMGRLAYSTVQYYFGGKLDEVSLWTKTLTPSEIACIYEDGVKSGSSNLALWYTFNQGIAGGNNAGINTLIDQANAVNAWLNNFALTGSTSNWVDGAKTHTDIIDTICQGDSYLFGSQLLTTSGIYTESYTAASGCDSTVILDLHVTAIDTSVTQNGAILIANASGATYQWVDCNNAYAIIPGAVTQGFLAPLDGSYAVILTVDGCTDTSACYTVITTGHKEQASQNRISVYPNPVENKVYLRFENPADNASVSMFSTTGKLMLRTSFYAISDIELDIAFLPKGLYFLQITQASGERMYKVLKH